MSHPVTPSDLICPNVVCLFQAVHHHAGQEGQPGTTEGNLTQTQGIYFYFLFLLYTLLFIPFGTFGPPYLGKTTVQQPQEQCLLPSPTSACWVVSVIHQTLTWTTGSLTCVCDYSYACVYTHGVGHTDSESAQHFGLRKTHTNFSCALDTGGVGTSDLWIWNPTLYQVSHLITPLAGVLVLTTLHRNSETLQLEIRITQWKHDSPLEVTLQD